MKSKLPRNLHIGMPKSGSSFFYSLIKQHPKIALGEIQKINFYHKNFDKGFNWYFSQFNLEQNKIPIDTSPKLFMGGEEVAQRIRKYVDSPKFILILRNPINYVYSHYKMHYNNGFFLKNYRDKFKKNPSFEELLEKLPEYLERGKYFENFQLWLPYFGLSYFKVILFEDFVKEPQKYIDEVCDFFMIERIVINSIRKTSKNVAMRNPISYKIKKFFMRHEKLKNRFKKSRFLDHSFNFMFARSTRLSGKYRKILEEYFREDIMNLGKLINQNLNIWKSENFESRNE